MYSKMEATRDFLLDNLSQEFKYYYGVVDKKYLNDVTNAWMNDESNSKRRYDLIEKYRGITRNDRILDMASGCGTFVFYGLLHGYDVYGIDPCDWKKKFNEKKIDAKNYPKSWNDIFFLAYGEQLPFDTGFFDIVSSYQTLEHVADVERCISEMLRVLKPGGYWYYNIPIITRFSSHITEYHLFPACRRLLPIFI